jgi:hypothetical protein
VEGVRRGDSLVFYVCIGELLVVLPHMGWACVRMDEGVWV